MISDPHAQFRRMPRMSFPYLSNKLINLYVPHYDIRQMITRIVKVDQDNPSSEAIKEGVTVLQDGGLVIFPTETVYGIGCNALSAESALRIFSVKKRPADNPLIVHISNMEMLHRIARNVPEIVERRWEEFWPGPLTIIFEASSIVPPEVTGGLSTVAVRMPSNILARSIIEQSGLPVAAPSANISTRPSITSSDYAIQEFNGSVDLIYDAGKCSLGLESTVIDIRGQKPLLLRAGSMNVEDISSIFGEVLVDDIARGIKYSERPVSPGTKYKHYSPVKPLALIQDKSLFKKIMTEYGNDGRFLFIGLDEMLNGGGKNKIFLGDSKNLKDAARNLFSSFREIDSSECTAAIIHEFPEEKEGLAIMNRVRKASSAVIRTQSDFNSFLESL